jgi:hypothetical protein
MIVVKVVSLLATLFIPGTDRNWNSEAIERNSPHGTGGARYPEILSICFAAEVSTRLPSRSCAIAEAYDPLTTLYHRDPRHEDRISPSVARDCVAMDLMDVDHWRSACAPLSRNDSNYWGDGCRSGDCGGRSCRFDNVEAHTLFFSRSKNGLVLYFDGCSCGALLRHN